MTVETRRSTVPTTTVCFAGIALGVTLVVAALIPALPAAGSRSIASSPSAVPPSQAHHEWTVAGPQRISIPRINLTASVVPVSLQGDGSLAAPEDFGLAGWYSGGTAPGAPGPSVIVGHVDSHRGPAVFFRLRELAAGHSIVIETGNNLTLTFVVERIEQHPKDRFPTTEVYGVTNQRALRLITCGGEFDRTARSYRDNIVVFASLAE